jgi:signal transduction histidine kinase
MSDQANSAQSPREFIDLLTHELKTPLCSLRLEIQLASKMLQARDSSPLDLDRLTSLLVKAERDAERITQLIEDSHQKVTSS